MRRANLLYTCRVNKVFFCGQVMCYNSATPAHSRKTTRPRDRDAREAKVRHVRGNEKNRSIPTHHRSHRRFAVSTLPPPPTHCDFNSPIWTCQFVESYLIEPRDEDFSFPFFRSQGSAVRARAGGRGGGGKGRGHEGHNHRNDVPRNARSSVASLQHRTQRLTHALH